MIGIQKPVDHARRVAIVFILLAGLWMSLAPFPIMGVLAPFAIIISIILSIHWRSGLPLLAIVLSPLMLGFGLGVREWFEKKPAFSYMGLPGNESSNLDPVTRCHQVGGGCVVRGNEWIMQAPMNAGLYVTARLLGPPKNSYRGAYPTKAEAIALTQASAKTPVDLFLNGKVLVDGKEIALGKKTAQDLLGDLQMIFFEVDDGAVSNRFVKAGIFKKDCLVVHLGSKLVMPNNSVLDESEGIFLFDAANLHPFARYVISGRTTGPSRMLVE